MADRQGLSYTTTAQAEFNPQLLGLYLGLVTMTRTQDLWVQVNIPQIFGTESSNWARPIGFNGAGEMTGDWAGITVIPQSPSTAATTGTATTAAAASGTASGTSGTASGTSGTASGSSTGAGGGVTGSSASTTGTAATATAASATSSGSGQPLGIAVTEVGPGPGVGTLVIVCFIGGDRNRPGYFMTSQSVSGSTAAAAGAGSTAGAAAGATSAATSTSNLAS